MRHLIALLLLTSLLACRPTPEGGIETDINYETLPAVSGQFLNVVVEVPAGTNHKIEYHDGIFANDTLNGEIRIIDFLPYPGNYGFIPSTLMRSEDGGDGDPLDVIVISESRPTGTVIPALPIGALLLRDRGEIDTKIIAVPADSTQRVFRTTNYLDFMIRQDAARRLLESWFLNYKGQGVVELVRWEDEAYAWAEIERWKQR